MPGWTYRARKWRDQIVNEYMAESGAERFDPEAFAAWVRERPEHPAYGVLHQAASEPS